MKKIYLDSNVLISLIKEDFGKGFKLMYANTEAFFDNCREDMFILSSLFLDEVKEKGYYSSDEVNEFFINKQLKTFFVIASKEDLLLAKQLMRRGMHFTDAAHAAIAVRMNCDYLVTWNEKDFRQVGDLIKVVTPSHFWQSLIS